MKIAQNSQRKWFPDASCGEPEKQFTEDQVGDGNEILVGAVSAQAMGLGGLQEDVEAFQDTAGDADLEPAEDDALSMIDGNQW